jgi:hypothetical protein
VTVASAAERTWSRQRVIVIVMTLAAVAILARSAIFLFRDQVVLRFRSGRDRPDGQTPQRTARFPLFLYGQN